MSTYLFLFVSWIFILRTSYAVVHEQTTDGTAVSVTQKGYTIKENTILFEIKGCSDAVIKLQILQSNSNYIYGIHLGQSNNMVCRVYETDGINFLETQRYTSVLDCFSYKQFWIKWQFRSMKVGKGKTAGSDVIMTLDADCPISFHSVFIKSGGLITLDWKFYNIEDVTPNYTESNSRMVVARFDGNQLPGTCKSMKQTTSVKANSLLQCTIICITAEDCLYFSFKDNACQCWNYGITSSWNTMTSLNSLILFSRL